MLLLEEEGQEPLASLPSRLLLLASKSERQGHQQVVRLNWSLKDACASSDMCSMFISQEVVNPGSCDPDSARQISLCRFGYLPEGVLVALWVEPLVYVNYFVCPDELMNGLPSIISPCLAIIGPLFTVRWCDIPISDQEQGDFVKGINKGADVMVYKVVVTLLA